MDHSESLLRVLAQQVLPKDASAGKGAVFGVRICGPSHCSLGKSRNTSLHESEEMVRIPYRDSACFWRFLLRPLGHLAIRKNEQRLGKI